MTIKDLQKRLSLFNPESRVLVSSDEELNTMYGEWQVAELSDRENTVVIYGLDGSLEE